MTEKKATPAGQDTKNEMVFTKKNYQLLLISMAIVVV